MEQLSLDGSLPISGQCLKKKVVLVFCIGILSFPLVGNLSSVRDLGKNRKKDSEQVGMTEGDKKDFAA
jgi:hypothetical protein